LKDIPLIKKLASVVAFCFALFYFYTSGFGILGTGSNLAMFILFTAILVMLTKPMRKGKKNTWWMDAIDVVLLLLIAASILYWLIEMPVFGRTRMGRPTNMDYFMGLTLIFLSLEVSRRTMGWVLVFTGLAMLSLLYFAHLLPGIFHHRGIPLRIIVPHIYFNAGIFGTITSVFAVFIMPFMIFGAFLKKSGAGEFFIRFCTGLAGRYTGGPAMIAVLASAIFGSINGSPLPNAMATGQFTIPLMKGVGYKGEMAAAVEAASSVGGSFLPPVMGAGAFILAATTNTPYSVIMTMAIVPGLMYFFALAFQVYTYARRHNLAIMDEKDIPDAWQEFKKGWYYFGSIGILAVGILLGYSIPRVAFLGCIFLFICSFFRKETRFIDLSNFNVSTVVVFGLIGASFAGFQMAREARNLTLGVIILAAGVLVSIVLAFFSKDIRNAFGRFKKLFETFEEAAKDTIIIGSAAGTMGIIMAGLTLHGLGINFSIVILAVAGGNPFITLLLVCILGMIMGLGLSITAAYLLLSIMVVPALTALGIDLVVAHMICFWLSMTSHLTPPVAVTAFATAGIAKSPPMRTAFVSCMVGIFLYIMPFTMAFSPQILVVGYPVQDVVLIIFFYIFVTLSFACATQGWLFRNLAIWERIALGAAVPLLMYTHIAFNLVGLGIFLAFAVLCFAQRKKGAPPPASPAVA